MTTVVLEVQQAKARTVKLNPLDHPITIEPMSGEVVVRAAGREIARTQSALVLREKGHAPVYYLPLTEVDPAVLRPSSKHTYCPFKGQASYYSVAIDEQTVEDAIWTYEEPYDGVREIQGRVAFYPHLVDITPPAE
jgi:uncharacterized protein (DUF427 family)